MIAAYLRRIATRRTAVLCAAVALNAATVCAQMPNSDSSRFDPMRGVIAMKAACPGGQRTSKQQAECKRVIDSIQASRARQLGGGSADFAEAMARDLLMDTSFVADDDGSALSKQRWVHIGTVADVEPGVHSPLEVDVGVSAAGMPRVGVLWTGMPVKVSIALQVDCQRKEAQVIKLLAGSSLNIESDSGIGPWYSATKPRSALQAIVRRACG